MPIFDVVTASGNLVSSISVGETEAILVGQCYNSEYLSKLGDYLGQEVSIKMRIDFDKFEKLNKLVKN